MAEVNEVDQQNIASKAYTSVKNKLKNAHTSLENGWSGIAVDLGLMLVVTSILSTLIVHFLLKRGVPAFETSTLDSKFMKYFVLNVMIQVPLVGICLAYFFYVKNYEASRLAIIAVWYIVIVYLAFRIYLYVFVHHAHMMQLQYRQLATVKNAARSGAVLDESFNVMPDVLAPANILDTGAKVMTEDEEQDENSTQDHHQIIIKSQAMWTQVFMSISMFSAIGLHAAMS